MEGELGKKQCLREWIVYHGGFVGKLEYFLQIENYILFIFLLQR